MTGGTEAGKRFEEKFRLTMERAGMHVIRVRDAAVFKGGRMVGVETEADFIVSAPGETFMVECKATGLPRLPFGYVRAHQEDSLLAFDAIEGHHGVLAVEFFDKRDYRHPHGMYLLPISEWVRYKEGSGRKSMPRSEFERLGVRLGYSHGAYVFGGRWSREHEAH